MAFDPKLAVLMNSTMKVYTLSGVFSSGYFTPSYTTTVKTWECRITKTNTLVRTPAGTEEMAQSVAWVRSTSTFGPSDKITVNGSTVGPLLRIDHLYDEDGLHHSKVWWG